MPESQASPFPHGSTPIPAAFISLLVSEFRLSGSDEILEIGCGDGYLARAVAPYVARVDALDESPSTLAVARELGRSDSGRVRYIAGRAEEFVPASSYNLVLSLEALHLVADKAIVLQHAASALAADGSICVAWVEYFWEAQLFPSYLAVLDLKALTDAALPDMAVAHGSRVTQVPQRFSLEEIASFLSSTSKAYGLSPADRNQLREILLQRFRRTGAPDSVSGQSRYVVSYCTFSGPRR
jgi:SAM-dependent methyltransferase